MTPLVAKLIHLAGMIAWWVIRRPFERKTKRNVITRNARDAREWTLLAISFTGLGVIPFVHVLTGFPAFADQPFSPARAWAGAAVFLGSLALFRATHKALGRNWSVTLTLREGHELVTSGVYRYLRHPMYTAFWLWAGAQALLLQNWVAGLSGLVGFGLLYAFRIGREEAMMRSTFGPAWESYASRTRRIIPFVH
ncbi:MAG TPA: protein-S-isoprenylcysteine O-methyltransferase [Acetobacteraceae bacterium]|nr:protein-S-isoprenylcysteine O-methyltransferase [Acetobacteraceae bacterium]